MRLLSVPLILIVVCCSISVADAGSVLERVKEHRVVRCGSADRPGLAQPAGDDHWSGLNVDVCRAIATAVLGSPDLIEYHKYETPKEFDAVRGQEDDVFFLTGSEINDQKLSGKVVPGPAVFMESHAIMVPDSSTAQHVSDLAGKGITFLIGSGAERSLEAYFDSLHKSFLRRPFSEDGEMNDCYNAQHCNAVAGEITTLAATRLNSGVNQLSSRILPEPLAVFPIIAATGTNDAQWAAVVAWTLHALVSSERPEVKWYAGGVGAMPISAPELGLNVDWQRRVLGAVGSYGDIFERNLGKGSPLKLDRGFNANQINGGLMLSPFLE